MDVGHGGSIAGVRYTVGVGDPSLPAGRQVSCRDLFNSMQKLQGTLTSLFKMDSARGMEIGAGFIPLCFELNQFIELSDKKKEELFEPILSTMKKLGRVADATDRYLELEKTKMTSLVKRHRSDTSSIQVSHQDSSSELEGAVDDVISNSKAALDAAVKLLRPLWGINLTTYGDAGLKVVKALKKNIPQVSQPKIEKFIQLIEANEPWLRKLRDIRTDTEHMGKTIVTPLGVEIINSKLHKEYPKVENQILASEFVDIVYKNLSCFLQDFIVLSLSSRFFVGLIPVVTNDEIGIKRKFGVAIEKVSTL